MQVIGVIVKGALALFFLLIALWLGVVAWAEIERGWWLEEADEPADEAIVSPETNGWTDLALAHAWYRDYTGGEPIVLDTADAFAPYIRDTAEFVALVAAAQNREQVFIEADDTVVAELARFVHQALAARARYFAEQPGGVAEALDALHLLFGFLAMIPPDSIPLVEIRDDGFGEAIQELRALAVRPGFPVREARPAFSNHLQAIESDDELRDAVEAERARRIRVTCATLEPGAREQSWLRPTWRALFREGEIVPLSYRDARKTLRTLNRLDDAIGLPRTEREAALDGLPADPVVARTGVLLQGRPGLRAAARITRLGLAALEYREEKGAWPMDPSSLEDRFDQGMPVDPFSGQLFPFHRSDTELYLAPSQPVKRAEWTLHASP